MTCEEILDTIRALLAVSTLSAIPARAGPVAWREHGHLSGGTGTVRFGNGDLTHEYVEGWAKIPAGWDLIEVLAVAVDSHDRLFAFTRSEHQVAVFDREGNFLYSWGEGVCSRPHGLFVGPDDSFYCLDDFDHTLRKCTTGGKVLMTLGEKGTPSDTGYQPGNYLSVKHGGRPFNRPTSVALSPEGALYVTDGYANCRVHKFSPEGKLLFSFGEPGSGPGQFRLVHGIAIDPRGTLYVGDRMNSRIQLFSPTGEYLAEWNDVYQPNDLFIDPQERLFVAEIGYRADLPLPGPTPAPGESPYGRVTVRNLKGEILLTISASDPRIPGGFLSPHGLRQDSRGDLYVGEVSATRAKNQGLNRKEYKILHKFRRMR